MNSMWPFILVMMAGILTATYMGLSTRAPPRIIVVGGGLAGLSAAHTVLQNGGRVVLVDKEDKLGGNSMKASSGINSAGSYVQQDLQIEDSAAAFAVDTMLSGTDQSDTVSDLVSVLSKDSASALDWLGHHFGVDLSVVSRLGGHSHARTHRPKGPPPGAAIVSTLIKKLEAYPEDRLEIMKGMRMESLITSGSPQSVLGVTVVDEAGRKFSLHGPVILATGGYANDHTSSSLLAQWVPHLKDMPTTNGPWATGEGVKAGVAIGVATVDMDKVQVHPTGFVHPDDPDNKTKFLCGEALRGEGGLLLNSQGRRFVNELDLRDAVTAKMNEQSGRKYIVLNAKAAVDLGAHLGFYTFKKLMKKYDSSRALAEDLGMDPEALAAELKAYNRSAEQKCDAFNKTVFPAVPFETDEEYYAGEVTPVLHYTMGGIRMNPKAQIMRQGPGGDLQVIHRLYGAGEVTGGV
eukprot:CAMPEP_0174316930 /NCGR_PEP_ID=MMETSP0810-20121108/7283_1 /TAXON_ID=73025 ORGANISM="Eutreptiella gymnastica-like, Strain CCMP1594" /NCGR_SAMPLE_ID=MMETSP0810 /ASSEMBLY_ACC=CAM_ASM_000659 /LENGTH=461 /DNA_ID=CAMNT_0015426817 /DNA_START=29 /DNA_END=1411 /DNA_ORIENTATION=-